MKVDSSLRRLERLIESGALKDDDGDRISVVVNTAPERPQRSLFPRKMPPNQRWLYAVLALATAIGALVKAIWG